MSLLDRLRGRRVGVVLSAGYFGFYGHAGFVEGLLASGITPSAWAGTSAGGMVAAFAAAGLPPARMAELILQQRREHFWDPDYLGIAVDAVRQGSRASGRAGCSRATASWSCCARSSPCRPSRRSPCRCCWWRPT